MQRFHSKTKGLLAVLCILLLSACVSTKKYQALESDYYNLKQENKDLRVIEKKAKMLQISLDSTKNVVNRQSVMIEQQENQLDGLRGNLKTLNEQFDNLLQQNQVLLRTTAGEKEDLELELANKQKELLKKEKEMQMKEADLFNKNAQFEKLKSVVDEKENEIKNLQLGLDNQRKALQQLKANIVQALSGFSSDELQVVQKADGKVYVSLSQNLLFAKGSTVIDQKGVSAIKQLANVLKNTNEVDILVEGHTDSDGTSQKNWDLSVNRATEVVKILQAEGVPAEKLVPSGRAFYVPVAKNDTETNKSLNRRTEIILSPKLDQILELIQKY